MIQALILLALTAGSYCLGYMHGYVTRHYRETPPEPKQEPARQSRIDTEA